MGTIPRVKVTSRAERSFRGEPTDTGVAFLVDFAERGPHDEAILVESLEDFEDTFGGRVGYSLLADSLELAFAEGLATAYIARQVGPDPVKASVTLNDAVPAASLKVEALYVGDYANGAAGGLSVQVVAGSGAGLFTIIVFENAVEVERFTDLVDVDAAIAALASSAFVRGIDAGAGGDPAVVARTNLAGGTDDHADATIDEFTAALDLFKPDLGPGQVLSPGRTVQAQHEALIAHARDNGARTAYIDMPDRASRATMLGAVTPLKTLVEHEYGAPFGTWYDIPGLVAGTTRAVPGSAFAAGVTARTDALEGTAGAAAAGEVSTARYAIDVRTPAAGFTDDDLSDLDDAGVNMAINFRNRGIQLYGFKTLNEAKEWKQLTAQRLRASLTAKLNAAWQSIPFRRIDARRHMFGDAQGKLVGVLLGEYQLDALYGETAEDAFSVDMGATVNTPQSISDGKVKARVGAKFAPYAEQAFIDLVKEPLPN